VILLDTHVLVWALMAPGLLSAAARQAIDRAPGWGVSSASLYEIRTKHGIGRWPEIGAICDDGLTRRLTEAGIEVVPADGAIMDLAGGMDWPHRDPFDRIIVATGVVLQLALVSKDETLSAAPAGPLRRIW
jgi:PIN domain nuclease of toxin-antitoxin system